MTDEFLINFAIGTLITISFTLQHLSQFLFNKIRNWKETEDDKRPLLILFIAIIQLISIGIIVELIQYALTK